MANQAMTTEPTVLEDETEKALSASLWASIRIFVKRCGGDADKVSPEEREAFAEELEAWAVLKSDDGDTE